MYDTPRDRYLVNIREPACVVALAGGLDANIVQLPLSVAGPHGLDLDREHDRAFVACDGGAVAVLDLEKHEEAGTVPIAGVPDAIWYNSRRERLYVAIGDPGVVDVVDTRRLVVDQQIPTELGAHTTAFDLERQLLYIFLPRNCRAAVYREI